jgi:Domain of unknown function (DUF4160)
MQSCVARQAKSTDNGSHKETGVPELCRFYGIVIRMYYDEHPPPHFHAVYQEAEAVVRIDTLDITRGALPRRAHALVLEWALAHRDDLRENWTRMENGEALVPSPPLD